MTSRYCILNEAGEVVSEGSVATSKVGISSLFGKMASSRKLALEVGTHSPWVSRQIASQGHEVIVANPHKVKLITQSVPQERSDRCAATGATGAGKWTREAVRAQIRHRGESAQADLAVIRARAELMESRTGLINTHGDWRSRWENG